VFSGKFFVQFGFKCKSWIFVGKTFLQGLNLRKAYFLSNKNCNLLFFSLGPS
jgi:hypothetical protein